MTIVIVIGVDFDFFWQRERQINEILPIAAEVHSNFIKQSVLAINLARVSSTITNEVHEYLSYLLIERKLSIIWCPRTKTYYTYELIFSY